MNALDVVLLVVIGVSVTMGLLKGLVREVFALVGVVLGIALALLLAPRLGLALERWIEIPSASYAAALLLVFVLTLGAVALAAHLVTKLIEIAQLGFVNRLLGGAFGILRGGLIGLVLVLGLTLFLDGDAPLLSGSQIAPVIAEGAKTIAPLLPDEPRRVFLERLGDLGGQEEETI